MRWEDGVGEGVVLEGQNADVAVATRSCQVTAGLWRRPGDEVDGGGVEGEFVDALPLIVLFPPDQDAAVVGARSEDGAILGMCPGNRPDRSLVSLERLGQAVLLAVDFEDLDGLVRGAGREPSAVVVENCIVLLEVKVSWSVSTVSTS